MGTCTNFVVLISANAEWRVVRNYFTDLTINPSPYGEWFSLYYKDIPKIDEPIIFIHGGWGKVAAAASTQYAIDQWHPKMVINLGTCGGFEDEINKGEIILAEKTIIYDIYEQMGDPDEHIKHYTTEIDNSWISKPFPIPVRRSLLVSGDRDIFCSEIPELKSTYGAIAGDWESGAIAWVSNKNHIQCLILRGVTDLVGAEGGEAYKGNVTFYYENTELIMNGLIDSLPQWLLKQIEYESGQKTIGVNAQ
jgi:adenosylhomocysteine nucleosidase